MPKECQPLKVSMCKGLGYSYVTMPNFFRDRTQREAELRIEEFSPLVKINCSPTLQFFLCLLYVPPCVINMVWKIPPCREVCEEARRGCEPVMLGIGFPWPEIMNCTRFPTYGRKGSGFCLKPKAKTTTGKRSWLNSLPWTLAKQNPKWLQVEHPLALRFRLARTCTFLQWFAFTLIKLNFIRTLAYVFHRLVAQRQLKFCSVLLSLVWSPRLPWNDFFFANCI